MKLSILIPAIPERKDKVAALYKKLEEQIDGRDVEILSIMDNMKMSIGKKRDLLVQCASGDYVAFVDDDDDIFDDYIQSLLNNIIPDRGFDVIMFDSLVTNNGMDFMCRVGIDHPNEELSIDEDTGHYNDIKRQPFHVCCWKSSLAKSERFKDISYGEDWDWCERLIKKVKTHRKIPKVLHHYKFDSDLTRASTESNEVWTNPNEEENESGS